MTSRTAANRYARALFDVAAKEGDVQQAGFSIGSLGDYSIVRDLDEQVADAAQRAVGLLTAKALVGGERTVILDPVLAGRQYPFGDLHRAGVRLAAGSDWTVSSADPLREIEVAVRRVARAAELRGL